MADSLRTAFDAVRDEFLPGSKNLSISWHTSLPGLYESAVRSSGGVPKKDSVEALMEIAKSYLDALEARTAAELKHVVVGSSQAAAADVKPAATDRLDTVMERAGTELQGIIDSEAQRARAAGNLEGIMHVASRLGDDDPTVFFVVVRDADLCKDCRRLHLMPDDKTPRVYKVSELSADYFNRKTNNQACVNGLHPHCRCSKAYLAQGWGFTAAGFVKFIGPEHDEYAKQRG
jgi:hypothetical protein